MRKCKACGGEMNGGADPRCPVTKSNHQLDRVLDSNERAPSEGRELEDPRVTWARGPHDD